MWMCDLMILVDHNNVDHNSLADLVAAVADTGATIVDVDEQALVIEAVVPGHLISVVHAMEGVAYVRCRFNYLSNAPLPMAA